MLFVLFLRQNVPMTERVYALVWNKFEHLSKEEMTSKRQVSGLIRVIIAGASDRAVASGRRRSHSAAKACDC
jgi:hypothetical protein